MFGFYFFLIPPSRNPILGEIHKHTFLLLIFFKISSLHVWSSWKETERVLCCNFRPSSFRPRKGGEKNGEQMYNPYWSDLIFIMKPAQNFYHMLHWTAFVNPGSLPLFFPPWRKKRSGGNNNKNLKSGSERFHQIVFVPVSSEIKRVEFLSKSRVTKSLRNGQSDHFWKEEASLLPVTEIPDPVTSVDDSFY